jgi:hypothetical protein
LQGSAGCRAGDDVGEAGALSVVEHDVRQLVAGAGRRCPTNTCGSVLRITAWLATDAEIADDEREQAGQRERMAWCQARVMDRRQKDLAGWVRSS